MKNLSDSLSWRILARWASRLDGPWLIRGLWLLLLVGLAQSWPQAAEHYVRAGADPNGSGADWSHAYQQLPAALVRGDTYYVASGVYPAYDFASGGPSEAPLIVKKATRARHGTSVGWRDNDGQGAAVFGPIGISVNHVILDGVSGRGPRGQGFEIFSRERNPLISFENAARDVTIKHINLHFSSRDREVRSDAIYGNTPCANIRIADCYIHDIPGCPLLIRHWTGLTFEFNWVARNRSTPVNHAEGVSTHGGGHFIFRNNIWQDIEGTACIVNLSAPTQDWQIYGNVFLQTSDQQASGFGHGVISDNFSDSSIDGLKFYNNNIVNLHGGASGLQFWAAGSKNIWACNNLWLNCGNIVLTGLKYDYNTYLASTLAFNYQPTAHDSRGVNDLFIDTLRMNFHPKQATDPGLPLFTQATSSTLTIDPAGRFDPDGHPRGIGGQWDRGAYAYTAR